MESKKRISRHKSRKSLIDTQPSDRIKSSQSIIGFESMKDMHKIYLSPMTQKCVGCRIGENITPDNPWVIVDKEKIEDNLDLHENSSEFLPLKKKILTYPEANLLVGSFNCNQDQKVEFFICTSINTKNEVLVKIREQHEATADHISKALAPIPRPWISLGSEEEVQGSMTFNCRALYEIDLCTNFPIKVNKAKFKIKNVEKLPNGYVEMLSGRFAINLIKRTCIDGSTQCTPYMQNKAIQLNKVTYKHKYTQYTFKYSDIKLTEILKKNLCKFIQNAFNEISLKLVINTQVNLYTNDYMDLLKEPKIISLHEPTEIKAYQDVINCKHKKISCFTWNPLISGIIAAAYTFNTSFWFQKVEPSNNIAFDTVFENHLVLIWSSDDNVRPKLYLHANREVTALSFCPFNENILVGGCSNGQILVWDITNKLAASQKRDIYTDQELQHHQYIDKLTEWIKKPLGITHVFPVIESLLKTSHNTPVSTIRWVPPTHYISHKGKYHECTFGEVHMQFLTAGLGGSKILIYDLQPSKSQSKKKKKTRLSKLPDALTQVDSKLKPMQHNFAPFYRLYVNDPKSMHTCIPITHLIIRNQLFNYVAENPSTLKNVESVTYFKMIGLMQPFDSKKQMICTTGRGALQVVSWEGTDYDQGLNIISENCGVKVLKIVHDGPILVCEVNSFFPNVLLTIGGSVFAVWEYSKSEVPILWRKSQFRYISGMWSFLHPLSFLMIRADTQYEFWNVTEISKSPVRIFKYKGNTLINMYSDSTKMHVRKKTYVTTDIAGAFKIFNMPSKEVKHEESNINETIEYINRVISIHKYTETLKLSLKKIIDDQIAKEEAQKQILLDIDRPYISDRYQTKNDVPEIKEVQDTAVNDWLKKQENYMYHILLEQKQLNLSEIESSRLSMQKLLEAEQVKYRKLGASVLESENKLNVIKRNILMNTLKIRRKISVTYPKEIQIAMKQTYIENYKDLEKRTVNLVKNNPYNYNFNWFKMINQGATNRRSKTYTFNLFT